MSNLRQPTEVQGRVEAWEIEQEGLPVVEGQLVVVLEWTSEQWWGFEWVGASKALRAEKLA